MEVCQRVGSFEKTVQGPCMPSFDGERDVWVSWYCMLQNILPIHTNRDIQCNVFYVHHVAYIIITVNFLLLEKVISFKNIKTAQAHQQAVMRLIQEHKISIKNEMRLELRVQPRKRWFLRFCAGSEFSHQVLPVCC